MRRDERGQNPFGNLGAAEFARRVAMGAIAPLDRVGNPIRPDMTILFKPSVDTIYDVVAITPVLDPRAPAGMVRLTLGVQFDLTLPVGQPCVQILNVGFKNQEAAKRAMEMSGLVVSSAPNDPPAPTDNGGGNLRVITKPGSADDAAAREEDVVPPLEPPPPSDDETS